MDSNGAAAIGSTALAATISCTARRPAVLPGDVGAAGDRREVAQGGMGAVVVVVEQPGGSSTPPASPQPAQLRLHRAGGRVGRRPIPQGRAAPFRRPVLPDTIPRAVG